MKTASAMITTGWKRIPRVEKFAFFAALIVGIVAHLTLATNYFVNNDSISTLEHHWENAVLTQGKWLQGYMIRLGGITMSSNVSVTMSVLMIAVTAAITVYALRIRRSVYAILTGMLMALIPALCGTFAYQIQIGFISALLFAALSVCTVTRGMQWWRILLSIVFLTLSLGTYQAYIGYAAGMFVLMCLTATLEGYQPAGRIMRRGFVYLGILFASVVLYYIILQVNLKAAHAVLSDYRGISAISSPFSLRFSDFGGIVLQTFKKVYFFFVSDAYGTGFVMMKWSYRIVALLCAAATALLIWKNGLLRRAGNLILVALFAALLPFAVHAIAILSFNADTGWRMLYPFVLIFVYLLKTADMLEDAFRLDGDAIPASGGRPALQRVAAAVTLLIVAVTLSVGYQWFVVNNQCYEKMRNAYEHVYAASVELNTDINRYPGFDQDTVQVGFVGDSLPELYACRSELFDYLNGYDGILNSEMISRIGRVYAFMEIWLGVDFDIFWYGDPYEPVDWEKFYDAEQMQQLRDMPVYPRDGSMQMVDGVLVVKLSEFYPEN